MESETIWTGAAVLTALDLLIALILLLAALLVRAITDKLLQRHPDEDRPGGRTAAEIRTNAFRTGAALSDREQSPDETA